MDHVKSACDSSDYRGCRVLVTGADGFIGSHLVEALVADGARVTALSLYNSFDSHGWLDDLTEETLASITRIRGDVRDAGFVRRIVHGQDVVFHLAALIGIPYSYAAPRSYVETNILGTLNVLEAARDSGVRRIVHTSTSEVYGSAVTLPISEQHPLQGQSPYSASKIGADMLAESFARSFEMPVVILRPFNTYGPRQSERALAHSPQRFERFLRISAARFLACVSAISCSVERLACPPLSCLMGIGVLTNRSATSLPAHVSLQARTTALPLTTRICRATA